MNGALPAATPEHVTPAVVVFGTDDAGKAHASWFDASEAALATKAASLMGMHALPLASDEHRQAVAGVARGRVFASGRAFVPFAKAALHAKLFALGQEVGFLSSVPAAASSSADQAEAGNVVATTGDDAGEPGRKPEAHRPTDWPEIQLGSLVLMSEGATHGWYEAIVIEAKPDDLFVLRWRDWPEEATHVRKREHLALLHPTYVDE